MGVGATDGMMGSDGHQGGLRNRAGGTDDGASRCKAASGGPLARAGHVAGESVQAVQITPDFGDRADQRPGVRVRWAGDELLGGSLFDDLSGIHHGNPLGDVRNETEIVGDHQDGHAHLLLDVPEQFDDLGLNGDVERRRGFIGDQQFWFGGQGHGDHDSLLHAPTELVGVILGTSFGCGDAHALQQANDFGRGGTSRSVKAEGFENLGSDPQDRIERGTGFLEDVADDSAADGSEFGRRHGQNITALQQNPATGIARGRSREEACDAQGGDAFAASAFAHEAQGLALGDGE